MKSDAGPAVFGVRTTRTARIAGALPIADWLRPSGLEFLQGTPRVVKNVVPVSSARQRRLRDDLFFTGCRRGCRRREKHGLAPSARHARPASREPPGRAANLGDRRRGVQACIQYGRTCPRSDRHSSGQTSIVPAQLVNPVGVQAGGVSVGGCESTEITCSDTTF